VETAFAKSSFATMEARPPDPCSEPSPSVKVARPLPLPPARARPQPGAASVPLKQPAAA